MVRCRDDHHQLVIIGADGETVLCSRCDMRWDREDAVKPEMRNIAGLLRVMEGTLQKCLPALTEAKEKIMRVYDGEEV